MIDETLDILLLFSRNAPWLHHIPCKAFISRLFNYIRDGQEPEPEPEPESIN